MAATIKIKNSSTTGSVPSASNLVQGELAVNVTDLGLYTENASGTVVKLNAPSIDDKDTGATKHLTISTGGNLGLGVTPSAWGSGYKALQLKSGSGGAISAGTDINVLSNAYNDGTNYKYIDSFAYASRYYQYNGQHQWHTTTSTQGAGNAITFTQAMTLDASGNLGVGTTSPTQKITANGSIRLTGNSSNFNETGAQMDSYDGLRLASYISTGSAIQFLTNASGGNTAERARIDSSGNLLVGTTSSTGRSGTACRVNVTTVSGSDGGYFLSPSNSYYTIVSHVNTTSGTRYHVGFGDGTTWTERGTISTNGSATTYSTSSDYRLKENVQPMVGALATVAQLKPCTYTWKESGIASQGFIAHELQEVVPEAVVGEKDAVNEDGSIKAQSIDTSFLVATLTAAIQELNAKFEAYKASHP